MPQAISSTFPVLYLYRAGTLEWLRQLFSEIRIPNAVVLELEEGRRSGCDVPSPSEHGWLQVVEPLNE